jgi:type III pantothenate kinase
MLLTIDIGNTNIVIGIFKDNQIIYKWRIITDLKKSIDDYAIDIVELCLNNKVDCLTINGSIIASVVPILTARLHEAVKKIISPTLVKNILVIGDDKTKLNIDIKIKNKNEVGHDRLINSIAGFKKFGGDLIIIDFGTATTFDVVGSSGEYLGGVIAPGINLSLKALHDMTSQLPKITVKYQKSVIGKSTVEAMNSGVYHGYIALVEGLTKKIDNELNIKTQKIITGGLSELFKEALVGGGIVDFHQPDLTLEGLKIIYDNNL